MKKKILSIMIFSLLFLINCTNTTSVEINTEVNDCGCIKNNDQDYYYGDLTGGLSLPTAERFEGDTPDSWDWRDVDGKDYTTPIKHQGKCGACYAFGTYVALESAVKIKTNRSDLNVDLSEQFMVSCGSRYSPNLLGCRGGSPGDSYSFVGEFGGIPESFFPYTSGLNCYEPSCDHRYSDWYNFRTPIKRWGIVNASVEDIKNALLQFGPLPTSMVVHGDFEGYNSGVYEHPGDESDEEQNHRVTIVGYNDNDQCWICKNSWGKDWGDNGWFRIAYGDCRIEDTTAFLELEEFDLYEITLDITMHRIKEVDEIDPWPHGEADWSYRFSVFNGLYIEHKKNDNYCDEDDDHEEDITHTFTIQSLTTTPSILVKVWDRDDVLGDHDLADVTPKGGGGTDNNINDFRGAMFQCKYDIAQDKLIESDGNTSDGEYIIICGNENNKAKVWFKITDDYETLQADAGGPYEKYCNGPITLTGSAIKGKPPYIFDWDLDCDGEFDDATGETITYSWSEKGIYTIKLRVTDSYDISIISSTTVNILENEPPYKPGMPSGPSNARTDVILYFTVVTTDPEGDKIRYGWDWNADSEVDEWTEYFDSGIECKKGHSWRNIGKYFIKVIAEDEKGSQSEWSPPKQINVPRSKNVINLLFLKSLTKLPLIGLFFKFFCK